MSARTASTLADPKILGPAVLDSFRKLDPRLMVRNPVMFTVEVVATLTTALFIRDLVNGKPDLGFALQHGIDRPGTAVIELMQGADDPRRAGLANVGELDRVVRPEPTPGLLHRALLKDVSRTYRAGALARLRPVRHAKPGKRASQSAPTPRSRMMESGSWRSSRAQIR